tara:strand:+ start:21887 stop:22648 length:762 start_codon:yes stop_codon:yes gene_type:complete
MKKEVKKNRILVIGETCVDIFNYGKVERLAPEAPAPVFCTAETLKSLGMAMNVKNNIVSLGLECDIVTNSGWENITKTRFIDKRTNHMFLRVDSENNGYKNLDVGKIVDKLDKYEAVIISDYCKGFLTTEDILKISSSHPNVFLDTKKILNYDWCRNVKFIKINFSEFKRTEHVLKKEFDDKLIITLGKDGSKHNGKIFSVPEVEIKDLAGAGDTFIASLVVKYVETGNIEDSIIFANKCATKVVQKRGVSIV